jgi:hypothetical protein
MMKAIAAVFAVSALMAGSAFAADKLIVKGSDGSTDVVKVTDAGQILFPNALAGKTAGMANGGGALTNFSLLSVNADPSATDAAAALQVVPRGTGYSNTIKSQITVYNTDYNLDSNNYEAAVFAAKTTAFTFNAVKVGTGVLRPIQFQIQNAAKMTIATNGYIGIGTTTPTAQLAVVGLRTFADNAAALADPTPLKAGDFYRTSTGQVMVVY